MLELLITLYVKEFLVPVTSPDHPEKTYPGLGVAKIVASVFCVKEPLDGDTLPPSEADTLTVYLIIIGSLSLEQLTKEIRNKKTRKIFINLFKKTFKVNLC